MKLQLFSVQAPSLINNDALKMGTVMQQTMKELNEILLEDDKMVASTKMVLNVTSQNGSYSSQAAQCCLMQNSLWRRSYELSKQL